MTREDLVAQLSGMLFALVPGPQADVDLTLEDIESIRQRTTAILDRAEMQVVMDAQMTAEDVADDIRSQGREEVGRD